MKNIVSILAIVIAFASCNSAQNLSKKDLTEISKGNLNGAGEEGISKQQQVITSDAEWNNLIKKMNTINPVTEQFATKIDFSKEMVIAVFDDVKSTGGYAIWVDSIQTKQDAVYVTLKEKQPKGMATSVITQPYYLAKMPKTSKEVKFKNATKD